MEKLISIILLREGNVFIALFHTNYKPYYTLKRRVASCFSLLNRFLL